MRIIVTSAGTDYLTISWETNSSSSQDGGRVYVYKDSDQVQMLEASSGQKVNATNLQPGTQYSIKVVTLSKGKTSAESQPLGDNTVPLPPTLSSVQAVDTKTLMITWTTQGAHVSVGFPD